MSGRERHRDHWIPPAALGVLAAILVHNAALSSYHLAEAALKASRFGELGANALAGILLTAGLLLCLMLFAAAGAIRDRMTMSLDAGGGQGFARLFDPRLATGLPGPKYKAWLVALGLVVILFLCALHWVAHEVWHVFAHVLHWPDWLTIAASVPLALGIAWHVRGMERTELPFRQGEPGQFDALIVFLSNPLFNPLPGGTDFRADFQRLMAAEPLPFDAARAKRLFGRNSWAMPMRAISELLGQSGLRYVVAIGSKGSTGNPGTRDLAELFCNETRKAAGEDAPEFLAWPPAPAEGVDFESFDELHEAIRDVQEMLERKGARRICLDVTGGTKICTIVGSMCTLEPGRNAMYVTTSDLAVYSYDFAYIAPGVGALPHEGV